LVGLYFGPAVAAGSPVHLLRPGFEVEELPVRLSNQNNLRFGPDGTLTSLGYDGRIWRLRDADGDGLEETAEPYWDRPTLSVPLGMAWSTHGLFVSSKGKVSLLRDTNADGRADQEEVIASGWPATDVGSGGVDATAVTLDREGNVYFGLLVADYSNAYRLRKRSNLKAEEVEWLRKAGRWREPVGPDSGNDEFSLYDPASPRGSIQRWDSRTRKLETFATGLRVPVALAFNNAGDLFNTDQEGETWMPNGNPLDELNHIVRGRHYGFPPRHATWLPGLVEEPPVVGFGPQHQSACGLVFNEAHEPFPVAGWKGDAALPALPRQGHFGPAGWSGDAFVAGESRGRIWRVQLAKSEHGYVGISETIARLDLLTLDLAISPKGDLYVCCHSGPPDWGTGPQGAGRIFRIRYTGTSQPQPIAVWPASPTEVRATFDRALDPSITNRAAKAVIEFGEYVSAGDRLEVLRPPYSVVEQQAASPRGRLAVRSASLADGMQTLVLATDPHALAVKHVLSLPWAEPGTGAGDGPASLELEYDLSGGEVELVDRDGAKERIWMPHPDLKVARQLTAGSEPHDRFFERLGRNGPWGSWSSLYTPGEGEHRLVFRPHGPMGFKWTVEHALEPAKGGGGRMPMTGSGGGWFHRSIDSWIRVQRHPGGHVSNLPLGWSLVPWAPVGNASGRTDSRPDPKPQGDWENGKELFFGRELQCARCHRVRGEGGLAGPDLSNLQHRDVRSIERDIREPGATLHPDYVTYVADLRSGEQVQGFLRSQDVDSIVLFDVEGKETRIGRDNVAGLHPAGQSLMPAGLLDSLKPDGVRDLLTFLSWAPPVRRKAEVQELIGAMGPPGTPKEGVGLRIVLVASKQDHGPGQHDYPRWQEKWLRLLRQAGKGSTVSKAWEWPDAEQFATADVLVLYTWNHDWSAERLAQLDAFQRRGGGMVVLHSACISDRDPAVLAERIGFAAQPGTVQYRHMPFELHVPRTGHVVTWGMPEQIQFLDEPYWPLIGDPGRVQVLASGVVDGAEKPLVWTFERGAPDGRKSRVVGSILGHYFWTLDDPLYRLMVLRAIAWAGRGEPELLKDAALIEANME
jgi:putative heme-binding domain-containing protein